MEHSQENLPDVTAQGASETSPPEPKEPSKSWFCVFNNPQDHGYTGEPHEIVNAVIQDWIKDNPQRTCAVTYCISAEGLHHLHAVFEDTKAMRFSKIKGVFPKMHIEATKGNKEQAESYILKKPPFDEVGEQVLFVGRHGEIKGRQGQRRDLDIIEELIQQGLTPDEILDLSLAYRKHEKMIKDHYFRKRKKETPFSREITVYWHTGKSGTGKSYSFVKLAELHGEHKLYLVGDYHFGFDKYNGEPILCLDEYRNQFRYEQLLIILGDLKMQTHARYANVYGLWNEIHITSVLTPDMLYNELVKFGRLRSADTYEQLRRRIDYMVFHFKTGDNEYHQYQMPMSEYVSYEQLEAAAYKSIGDDGELLGKVYFEELPKNTPTPFDNDTWVELPANTPTPFDIAEQLPIVERT